VQQYSALVSFEKVYAPFDGVITARNTDLGDLINSAVEQCENRSLFTSLNQENCAVYVNVPEEYSRGIQSRHDSGSQSRRISRPKIFRERWWRTADDINLTTRTLLIEIDVDILRAHCSRAPSRSSLGHPNIDSTFLLPVNTLHSAPRDYEWALCEMGRSC